MASSVAKVKSKGSKDVKSLIASNWNSLVKPSECNFKEMSFTTSEVVVEPLERGFGTTIGNSLRRILLSSLQGAAVVAVKIEGVDHEYSAIPGVMEDVVNIILNIKKIIVKYGGGDKRKISLSATGPGPVTAGMIDAPVDVEIVNKDHVICNLDVNAKINMEMYVMVGKGYVAAAENKAQDFPIGVIPIDSLYSPVKRVNFKVDHSRVGSETEYDKLVMTVETNGALTPELAVALSARILQDQLSVFVTFNDVEEVKLDQKDEAPFDIQLLKRVADLELSVRSYNCLKNDNIKFIGDLVNKTEAEMLRTPNFGRKSLNEIKAVLGTMGLRFGMDEPNWPPQNLEELLKKYEDKINQ